MLNENLKNVSGLTYKGDPLSEENKIEGLPTDVTVDGYDFKIGDKGEVGEEVIHPGNSGSGGEYGSGMTRDELEQYLLEIAKKVKEETKEEIYPVGSIYISIKNEDPSTLFGGEWEEFGVGRTLISTTDQSEQTGGESTVTLTENNLPSHTHSTSAQTVTSGIQSANHTHSIPAQTVTSGTQSANHTHTVPGQTVNTSTAGEHTHETRINQDGGSGSVRDILRFYSSTVGRIVTNIVGKAGKHKHSVTINAVTSGANSANHTHSVTTPATTSGANSENHTHSVTIPALTTDGGNGKGEPINIQNPYITVYMWKRIA